MHQIGSYEFGWGGKSKFCLQKGPVCRRAGRASCGTVFTMTSRSYSPMVEEAFW